MKTPLLVAGLLSLLAAGDAPAPRPEIADGRDEAVAMRLVRTIYVGAPVGLSRAEVARLAADSAGDYEVYLLAGGAALALGLPEANPEWPAARRLDHALEKFVPGEGPVPRGAPAGWDRAVVVHALTRALATTGRAGEAEAVLAKFAGDPGDPAGALALVALKQIGSANANRLLRAAAVSGKGGNLAENLVSDTFTPYLAEPELNSVPWDERSREGLLHRTEGAPCECMAADAAHLLGFLPPAADPGVEARELAALRRLAGFSTANCFHTRHLALKALALRSPETLDFWLREFDREPDAWTRDLLARTLFARFGAAALEPLLARLAREPAQYVQWTLMHGQLQLRRGASYFSLWDLWNGTTLQHKLDRPARAGGALPAPDGARLLSWLESGARPRDEWVWNHLQYGLFRDLRGGDALRLLRYFGRRPDRAKQYWLLQPLAEPAALPQLREWAAAESDRDAREPLLDLIRRLEPAAPPRVAD